MSVPFFYLAPECWGDTANLEGQEARHLGQVLRAEPGTEVGLLDGRGRSGIFVVRKVGKKNVQLERVSETLTPAPLSQAVVALAYSKAVRRGFFMEKAVELGAHGVWLWQGDHSQGKLSATAEEACLGQMIAGAKQSGNPWLPEVRPLWRCGSAYPSFAHCRPPHSALGTSGRRTHAHPRNGGAARSYRLCGGARGRLFSA